METKILIPNAPILVESTRSIGYSFESAIADIFDNSIGKGAHRIDVFFDSLNDPYVAILDDACGMTKEELEKAMQYGSKSSLMERDKDDLGRFGLGLKMASLSQCRCLTVITKCDGKIHGARWDLDHIIEMDDWSLIEFNEDEIKNIRYYNHLNEYESGTLVIWENFDRLAEGTNNFERTFDVNIENARKHISLVFHRFMGGESIGNKLSIFFNNDKVDPIDPFLTNNPATQVLSEQSVIINDSQIKVRPYILPHISKLKSKDKKTLGELADLRYNQGFYIYRNKRLIIWGTWFRLIKNQELNKLARVKVDIPNSLDSIWQIDIKKSSVSLPDIIKKNLANIVKNTVGQSERVYKYRGRKATNDNLEHIWNVIDNRGTFKYEVNRNISIIQELIDNMDQKQQCYFESLLQLIEQSFPYGDVYYRIAKNDEQSNLVETNDDEIYKIGCDFIQSAIDQGLDVKTVLENMDKIDYFSKYPDVVNKIRGEYKDE